MNASTRRAVATYREAHPFVDPYEGHTGESVYIACGRCGGEGIYRGPGAWRVTSHDGSSVGHYCFSCLGEGGERLPLEKARRRARDRWLRDTRMTAQREQSAFQRGIEAMEAAKAQQDAENAAWADFARTEPVAAAALEADHSGFAASLRDQIRAGQALTAAQHAALVELMHEHAMAKQPVPEGRTEVEGVVRSTKYVENTFSPWGGGTVKMVVLDDRGFKVYGTVPSALGAVERGDRVAFTATLERSQDDQLFGFYARPTKARRA